MADDTGTRLLGLLRELRLAANIRGGAFDRIRAGIHEALEAAEEAGGRGRAPAVLASAIVLSACDILEEIGYDIPEALGGPFPLLEGDRRELERRLAAFFDAIEAHIRRERRHRNTLLASRLRRYVDDHFNEEIGLGRLSREFRLSPGYISLLFSAFGGTAFSAYLTEVRLRRARELLAHTPLPIYQIARQVGYRDPYYFSTCFRKRTGLPPSEYRKRPVPSARYPGNTAPYPP